jgi:hypothetical protein
MSGSDANIEDSLDSEYIDMEKLDDEKMAELLLDDCKETEDLEQPLVLISTEEDKLK